MTSPARHSAAYIRARQRSKHLPPESPLDPDLGRSFELVGVLGSSVRKGGVGGLDLNPDGKLRTLALPVGAQFTQPDCRRWRIWNAPEAAEVHPAMARPDRELFSTVLVAGSGKMAL